MKKNRIPFKAKLGFCFCLRNYFVLVVFIFPFVCGAQKLVDKIRKKYFGSYGGTIAAYTFDSGKELISVEPTTIRIQLSSDNVIMDIGKKRISGTYMVLFKGKDYYVLDVSIDEQIQHERIIVHEKKHELTREGFYPQPNALLKRIRKKDEEAL